MFVVRIANIAAEYGFPFTEQEFINALGTQKADMDAVNAGNLTTASDTTELDDEMMENF